MIKDLLLVALGGLLGWLVAEVYANRANKQQKEQFEETKALLQRIENVVRPSQPQLANTIASALQSGNFAGAEPTIISEADACPSCGKQSLKFTNWGVGPFGPSHACYQCTNCHYRFQTMESSSD
ncbi:MAG: hypothetical protein ACKVIH_03715 [Burkholderiales bacterium]